MDTGTDPMSKYSNYPISERDNLPSGDLDPDRETAQMREHIARTRAEMSGTIEELHGKLNPAVLKEQAVDQFHEAKETIKAEFHEAKETIKAEVKAEFAEAKAAIREATIGKVEHMVHSAQDTVKETSYSIVDTIKQNPVPVALAGIGLAWLFINARGASARRTEEARFRSSRGYGDREIGVFSKEQNGERRGTVETAIYQFGEKAGGVASSLQNKAGNVAHTLHDKAGTVAQQAVELAHRAETSIGEATHDATRTLNQFAQDARVQGRRLEDRALQTFDENPIAVGAAVLAVGTVIGLAIPITRREDVWMGETRDELMHKAGAFAEGALGKVGDAAKNVTDDAARAFNENGSKQKMAFGPNAPT